MKQSIWFGLVLAMTVSGAFANEQLDKSWQTFIEGLQQALQIAIFQRDIATCWDTWAG